MKRHTLVPFAVDKKDGTRSFFLDREDGDGSTFYESKLTRESGGIGTLDIKRPIQVETVDLARWIRENLTKSDYIALKLDVEGAEYDVLERMIETDVLSYVNALFIEWHWQKVRISEERHLRVVQAVTDAKIPIVEWDALGH